MIPAARRKGLRSRIRSSIAAAMAAVADGASAVMSPEGQSEQKEPAALRELEMRPILKLVTPLLPCPQCRKVPEIEWREDGQALRVGCVQCNQGLECLVAPETVVTEAQRAAGCKPVADLKQRQRSAQADVAESWNAYAGGMGFDIRTGVMGHVKTKVTPDWAAINGKAESEKPQHRGA